MVKRSSFVTPGALGAAALLTCLATAPVHAERDLAWATSATGSGGHAVKVDLMAVLNREWEGYSITVLPTAGAIATVRGYALGEFDGYYGADVAFQELADDSGRFEGFRSAMEREPVQSFWAYTMEVGLAVSADDQEAFDGWGGLSGKPVFTGPAPWDVRAQLERAMAAAEVSHEYTEIDIDIAGSSLNEGTIRGFNAYTTGESSLAPWVNEAMLSSRATILNPSEDERRMIEEAGMEVVAIDPDVYDTDVNVDTAYAVPFFYGFHLGPDVPEEDLYEMLTIIDEHSEELRAANASFAQIDDDIVDLQRRGVAASGGSVPVHPGLARFLKDNDAWDDAWDDWIYED
ncbi:TAXI family TRAP transporter solute-binding subunit [Aquisalimonas sp.]|uniref:TAXI family TRAP transporter solute-binding subunit n=1 Tax=unclassified Aquisalimonas TaxID=2644645 RepID=UPI0025BF7CA4|nr:TAXI family TRAP transporter solute-binding subunit [Aquisalimonas sp.]